MDCCTCTSVLVSVLGICSFCPGRRSSRAHPDAPALQAISVLHVRVVTTLPSMQLQCEHLLRVPFGMCHGIGRSIAGALSKSSARYFPVGVACNSFATRFRNLSYDGIPTSRVQQRQSPSSLSSFDRPCSY